MYAYLMERRRIDRPRHFGEAALITINLTEKEAHALLEALSDINKYVDVEMFSAKERGVSCYNRAYEKLAKKVQDYHARKV